MANTTLFSLTSSHLIYNTKQKILLQQTPVWHFKCAKAFSEVDKSSILHGLDGVGCQIDDVLVFGQSKEEHDQRLLEALKTIEAAGAILIAQKCEFGKTSLKFLGHCFDNEGVRADPKKTSAIHHMKPPTTVPEIRRFMGMVNQLGKFSPNLAQLTEPLQELLSKIRAWQWGPEQQKAFLLVKTKLSKLFLYDPQRDHTISADVSSYGLGAVFQRDKSEYRPVAFASRYSQIEKEALNITWSFEKFCMYFLGKSVTAKIDHNPLVPLLNTKQLDSLAACVLWFRVRLDRYDFTIKHVEGINCTRPTPSPDHRLPKQTASFVTLSNWLN